MLCDETFTVSVRTQETQIAGGIRGKQRGVGVFKDDKLW